MPFDFGSAFRGGADSVVSAPLIGKVFCSPLWVALLITVLCYIIIFALLDSGVADADWKKRARVFTYIFMGVGLILFLHFYAFRQEQDGLAKRARYQTTVDSIYHSADLPRGSGYVPVTPGLDPGALASLPQEGRYLANVPAASHYNPGVSGAHESPVGAPVPYRGTLPNPGQVFPGLQEVSLPRRGIAR